MANVVLGVGSSHGPTIQSPPDHLIKLAEGDTRDPRFDYEELCRCARPGLEKEIAPEVQCERHAVARSALSRLSDIVTESELDVLLVISNTHRVSPVGSHPVFCVFRAESFPVEKRSDKPFDPDARFLPEAEKPRARNIVEKPGQSVLANHLIDFLIAEKFDIACMDRLAQGVSLDDAFAFPYEWLLKGRIIPLVPFMLSRDLPNQATPKRCYELGAALRRAIEAWPEDLRVGLMASGGLSHQIVDEELDRQVISALVDNNAEVLCNIPRNRLNAAPGTPEILNWIALAGAMAPSGMTLVDYLPIYRSLAGTGHGLTFGFWE